MASMTKRRHDWRDGHVQHCGNVGCAWQRRSRAGLPKSAYEYRFPSQSAGWFEYRRVPPCEGRTAAKVETK